MIQDAKQFVAAINQLCAEKNLPKDKVMEAVKAALKTAYRKDYGNKDQNIQVEINEDTGAMTIYLVKIAVKKVENPEQEIALGEAKKYKKDAKADEEIWMEVTPPADYGRIAAQAAKQVIMQRIQEAERDQMFETFKERENELVSALVSKVDDNQVFLEIERNLVLLPNEERVPGERYFPGTRLKVFLNKVVKTTKGPQLWISRKHPDLVRKLFEVEIPEIRNGVVEIKKVARVAGVRSKIAVSSKDEKIDPIGACVGQKGVRIQNIIRELNGEMIDVIQWSEDREKFIKAALSPAKIESIAFHETDKRATIFVPTDQRPLAIGKQGQNVKLASELTEYELDIRDASEHAAATTPVTDGAPVSTDTAAAEPAGTIPMVVPPEKDSLELLGLGDSVMSKLKKAGINTVSQLQQMALTDLTQIGGIGQQSAHKIQEMVQAYGKKLAQESPAQPEEEQVKAEPASSTEEPKEEASEPTAEDNPPA